MRSRRWQCFAWVVTGMLAVCAARPAAGGEPTAADKDVARKLMGDGRSKRSRSDLRGALESFEAADAIMGVPTTRLEVARTQAALGRLIEARDSCLRTLRDPVQPDEPPPFTRARSEIRSLEATLRERIPTVKVELRGVPASTEATILLDDRSLPAAALAVPLSVNPGHHRLTISAQSRESAEVEFDVQEYERKDMVVELHAAKARAALGSSQHASPRTHPTPSNSPSKLLVVIGTMSAGAGLLVGSAAGGLSLLKTRSARETCQDGRCPPSTHDDLDTAHTAATVANVSFIVAGAGVGLAFTGMLLGYDADGRDASRGANHGVEGWVGLGSAGVHGRF